MKYRLLGRTGLEVSEISIGTEWLHKKSPEEMKDVITKAIDYGVNYFDIVFNFPDYLEKISYALAGKRDKIILTHHLGSHYKDHKYNKTRSIKKCLEAFEEYQKIMKTEYVDLLFIHFIMNKKQYEECIKPGGVLELALKLKEEGKARFLAISTHSAEVAIEAANSGKIDAIMTQINIASNAMPLREEMLTTCKKNNVAIIAMKPFGGGTLLQANQVISLSGYKVGGYNLADKNFTKKKIASDTTPAKCLHYVLSQIGVTIAVPGVASKEELDGVMKYYTATEEELDYSSLIKEFNEYVTGECVYCNHCQPCPADIDIGYLNRLYDVGKIIMTDELKKNYNKVEAKASACVQCGDCLDRCPFEVKIIEKMKDIAAMFE
ncbi:MAG: aldo/keto reductase [Candidatus Thorarchaeota archaeon]